MSLLSQFVNEKNDISRHIVMSLFQRITFMINNSRPYFTQLWLYFSYLQLPCLSHCLDITSHNLDYNPSLQTGPQRTLQIMFCYWDVCWEGCRVLCSTQMERWSTDGRIEKERVRWRTDGRGGEVLESDSAVRLSVWCEGTSHPQWDEKSF